MKAANTSETCGTLSSVGSADAHRKFHANLELAWTRPHQLPEDLKRPIQVGVRDARVAGIAELLEEEGSRLDGVRDDHEADPRKRSVRRPNSSTLVTAKNVARTFTADQLRVEVSRSFFVK